MAKGIVIKTPKGAAGEYAKHSVSIYRRCKNQCEYCYLDKGIGCKTLGHGTPELRSCFKDEADAINKFKRELIDNREQLIKDGGVFFCFTTDPCLPETINVTNQCAKIAILEGVPVTILTKMAWWIYEKEYRKSILEFGKQTGLLCVGFTLTGRDDKEPFADSNRERVIALKDLHFMGIKTFASIEPIIQFNKSMSMIRETLGFCDLYKIGLLSKVKKDYYDDEDLAKFVAKLATLYDEEGIKMYIKESIRRRMNNHPIISTISVSSDFNIFRDLCSNS